MKKTFFFGFVLILLLVSFASALVVPENIQKLTEYNNQQALSYLETITFVIAFLAGLIAILSPCSLALAPMYLTYGLKERSTLHTFSFFAGFSIVFVLLGVLASAVGKGILLFQEDRSFLVFLAGLLLVMFGLMQIFGKGFSFFSPRVFHAKNILGDFILGVLFALGWSACTGPVLSGVLLIALVLGSYVKVALLMFLYALGNFVPFFFLSFAVDRFKLYNISWIRGKNISFSLFGEKIETHSTNIFSGILLLLMGVLFLIFRNTLLFNSINIIPEASVKVNALQNGLFTLPWVNVLGVIVFVLFIGLLLYFLVKKYKKS
ncbi:cytochrome c biogenesis protein CcdA [Candidatus Woesearchaeota archaeon]|nr:cytochrome c biogenesis protein CcdA [Candidatus Woesearchaeota archaeon]